MRYIAALHSTYLRRSSKENSPVASLQSHRLQVGGRIDREQRLNFQFNGRQYQGYAGDTLASALLANGKRVVGRSFKFHRPRGILSAGVEECNALLKLGKGAYEEPNVRATLQPLYEGLYAQSQNCWPSVEHDFAACLDLLSDLWPAGFYNKTFMWPNWHCYESLVRKAAGLGTLPPADDADYYTQQNAHCDVLVCGAGPAGLSAALAASTCGARVIIVDEEIGGSLLWRSGYINEKSSESWLNSSIAKLENDTNVRLLCSARAVGFFDHNVLMVSERLQHQHNAGPNPRERLWKIRAKQVVLATGAIEQPLMFPNNDRPGIMLASAVSQYANRYAVATGKSVVIATNNDSAYQTAFDLDDAGVAVQGIIDCRSETAAPHIKQIETRGIPVFPCCLPMNTHGRHGINSVDVVHLDNTQRLHTRLQCDSLAMSGGWQPAVHLFSQAKGKLRYDANHTAFLPDRFPVNVQVVGAAKGNLSLAAALNEGYQAGLQASGELGYKVPANNDAPFSCQDQNKSFYPERATIDYKPEQQWVDFQHDVTLRDIQMAARENYISIEHLKRFTTTGMSVDQGKTSNINALTALAECTNKEIEQVGTTTFRPFYMPVTLGAIAGRRRDDHYAPIQRSPMYRCHEALGAEFHDYGHWRRPAAYPRQGETLFDAMQREALAVRQSLGIFDGSSLGKIEVRGQDAAEFLNRFYINNVHSLNIGRARYGLMLNENGIVVDDGVFVRISKEHFLVHTTSGNANYIFHCMEEWQQREWPELDVLISQATSQWANVTLSGPRSRDVLNKIGVSIDLQAENFPHMHYREGELGEGIPVRILRASFTGEMGYEINVPASYGVALWNNLLAAGESVNITPYGIESLMTLRTEKGYLHVGVDTDGTTNALDLGWGGAIAKKSADFIGKRSLSRPNDVRAGRSQLVGISANNAQAPIIVGTHIINQNDRQTPAQSQGYVTSACYSPHLKRWIGLALVKNGRERKGEDINLFHYDSVQGGNIVDPVFFDPEGERLHA